MPRIFVAIDVETTGLKPETDAIIEIGAVKFVDGAPVDEFITLVDPRRHLAPDITLITGITDQDLIGKPRIEHVIGPLMRFVGEHPVVGHNVGFDLGFFRAVGALTTNDAFDTWELATMLVPALPSYSLGSLAAHFNVRSPSQHRAGDDALATGKLFTLLCERTACLPAPILLEINRIAANTDWPARFVFAEALAAAGLSRVPREEIKLEELCAGSPLYANARYAEPLEPVDMPEPVDVADLCALLEPDGGFGRLFPNYEHRSQQIDMLSAVCDAFNRSHHLMAEAGTGTGKSLAYLLPAIAYAVKNQERVVISTNTINLQDQLFKKDLPDLQRCLSIEWGCETPFRAVLLKGRSNYLCPRRFAALKARPELSHDELRGITRILTWLPQTETGDQSELSLPLPSDRSVWSQVSAENEGCTLERCFKETGGRCFFYRVRKAAEAAHVIVVNHALLMADAATGHRVLPAYRRLVIDEAHHLEDAVTDQLSFKADGFTLAQLFNTLHPYGASLGGGDSGTLRGRAATPPRPARTGGLLGDLLAVLRSILSESNFLRFRDILIRLQGDVDAVHTRLGLFWEVIADFVREAVSGGRSEYDLRLRITSATRAQPVWVDVEVAWDNLGVTWQVLIDHLDALRQALEDLGAINEDNDNLERLREEFANAATHLAETHGQLEAWVMKPEPGGVYWVEVSGEARQNRKITLRSAPVHVGSLVQENILFHNETVILTSATLRTAGSFDYVRDRLSAQDADMTTVGSPFDYKSSTLLYLPTDLPEPNAPQYQTAVEQTLIQLARATNGRLLALFTSYSQLKRTAQAILPSLTAEGITVLTQGAGSSRHQLLDSFKGDGRTVLLGTRSFWEGVDVVGPALSAVVLVKLPFAVPTDPIVAARSETFEDPFYNYQVPDAILRFRQGFGRLIRSKMDRGVVVVLDKRVTSKSYGRLFLESLPECTVQKAPLMNLPSAARTWLADAVDPALTAGREDA